MVWCSWKVWLLFILAIVLCVYSQRKTFTTKQYIKYPQVFTFNYKRCPFIRKLFNSNILEYYHYSCLENRNELTTFFFILLLGKKLTKVKEFDSCLNKKKEAVQYHEMWIDSLLLIKKRLCVDFCSSNYEYWIIYRTQ